MSRDQSTTPEQQAAPEESGAAAPPVANEPAGDPAFGAGAPPTPVADAGAPPPASDAGAPPPASNSDAPPPTSNSDAPQASPAGAPATGDPAFGAGAPALTAEGAASGEVVEGPPTVAAQEEALADPLAAARADAEKYLALAQRAQADYENYRKRAARETAAALDRGMAKVVKELLTPLDHLNLALAAAKDDDSELAKGIRLVQDEITSALARVGIQAFSPVGEPFDPNEHEAMVQQPREGYESGTVAEVYQPGYRINGAVLRPARVVVAA